MALSIPTATVLAPADYEQLASITKGLVDVEGVSFTRFVRKDVIQVCGEGSEFEIGKGVVLHESADDKATIITSGIMVDEALKAYEALAAEGIVVRVIDMFTWKPLDEELVLNAPTIQEFVGVQDLFGQVGPQNFLMDTYGLRASNIVEAVKKAISRK